MHKKVSVLIAFSAFLMAMCTTYDQGGTVASANGLSCQNFTDYGLLTQDQGAACFYVCPDGTVRQPEISEKFSESSPLYSASEEELDAQFCSIAQQATSTISSAVTSTASPASVSTASPTLTPTGLASPTVEISPTSQSPLLTGAVTLCDETLGLISFRIVQPAPDLTDKVLTVQISDQETTCEVNPVNTSLLTCDFPVTITFPARVLVTLDGAVVNDFNYDGIGCILVDTAIPNNTQTP
jgi:hypothetical protein